MFYLLKGDYRLGVFNLEGSISKTRPGTVKGLSRFVYIMVCQILAFCTEARYSKMLDK